MDFPERPIRCDRAGEVKEMGKTQDIREVRDDLAITG
jgi:hypothetical protein